MWDLFEYIYGDLTLSKYSQSPAYTWAFINFMYFFTNIVKKFLVKKRTRNGIGTLEKVRALLLLILEIFAYFLFASLFCS